MKNAKDSIIYADNYFTSHALVKFLRDNYQCLFTGAARENRICKPHLKETSEMNKQSTKRGDIDFQSLDWILALKWINNKVITISSSGTGVEPMSPVSRYDKHSKSEKDVFCPNVIKCYNSNMGELIKVACKSTCTRPHCELVAGTCKF